MCTLQQRTKRNTKHNLLQRFIPHILQTTKRGEKSTSKPQDNMSNIKLVKSCRTMLILRTISVLLNTFCLAVALREEIFSVLNVDKLKMERWDPTEIIASPFPVEALRPVVFQACRSIMTPTEFILTTILLLYQGKYSSTNLDKRMLDKMIKCTMNYMIMMAALSIIMLVVSIFCGASPFANIHHTVLASMFFTQMAFGYIQPNDNEPIQMAVKRVFLAPDYTELTFIESLVNELNCYILYGTVVMTIPFVVLNILDGGMQIQRWPIPIILGSFYGHILGFTIGTLVGLYRLYKLRFGKRNEELQNESSSLSPSPLSKERQA